MADLALTMVRPQEVSAEVDGDFLRIQAVDGSDGARQVVSLYIAWPRLGQVNKLARDLAGIAEHWVDVPSFVNGEKRC